MSRSLDFDDGFTSSNPSTANTLPASDVTVTPSGNLSSDDVQSALVELQTEIDTLSTSAELAAHAADSTDVHGVTGSVVGTEGAQTLSSKTLASPVVTGNLDASAATTVSAGTSNSPTTVNIGTGSGGNTINIGGPGATVVLAGTTITENATNSDVQDKLITINKGGAAASAGGTGFEIEENNVITGYSKTSGDRNSFEFKAPNTNGVATLTPGASADSIVLAAATQTLSGKSFSDAVILPEIATPSTPSSGNGKIYFKSDGFLYQLNDDGTESKVGSGSGGGGINYIADTDAEAVANSWTTYADAAGAQPVNGTAGSPTVTWTRTTSNPLRGTASFLFTKDAANRQGEGASYDFTISAADKAKVLTINFDYIVASGTFVAGSSTTDSDVTVWIYDVTNSVLIQPSSIKLLSNSSTIADKYSAQFQTASDSTSYRLILHVGSTSASAYTLKFDNISVGPSSIQLNTNDIVAKYTVSGTRTPTTTKSVNYDTKIEDTHNSVTTVSGDVTGWKFTAPVNGYYSIQLCFYTQTGAASTTYYVYKNGVSDTALGSGVSSGSVVGAATTIKLNAGDYIDIRSDSTPTLGSVLNVIAIAKAASPLLTANCEIVAANITASGSTTIAASASDTKVAYNTIVKDSHGAFNTSTNTYTVPVSGWYKVRSSVRFDSLAWTQGNRHEMSVYKNGSSIGYMTSWVVPYTGTYYPGSLDGERTDYYNAGDTIDIRVRQGEGSTRALITDSSINYLMIDKVNGPAGIQSSETIAAKYTSAGTTTFTTSGVIANFDTKVFDTHSAVTTGASWKFTAPVAGIYAVHLGFFASTTNGLFFVLRKNGANSDRIAQQLAALSVGLKGGSTTINLNAGDYIDVFGYTESSTAGFAADATLNYLSIFKVK